MVQPKKNNYSVLKEYNDVVLFSHIIISFTGEIYHSCDRKEYYIIVRRKYIIIFHNI